MAHLRISLQRWIANTMWLFWGLVFSPLKLLQIIKFDYLPHDFNTLQTPVIIASNHRHPLDPLIIGIAMFPFMTVRLLPFAPYGAALHRLTRPGQRIAKSIGFIQAVYYLFNVVRIPAEGSLSEKLSPLLSALTAGESVLIFPEGRSYAEDNLRPFKNGVAALHTRSNIPVVPCAINYYKWGWFPCAVVSFGAPSFINTTSSNQTLEEIAETVRQTVCHQYQKITKSVY